MKLDTRAFAIAAAIIAAALFLICAFFVAVAPETTTKVAGHMIHANLSGITRSLTWGDFIGGLVCWTLGTGFVAAALAGVYNRLARAGAGAGQE
jgi:CDP-diglyceride synthetase